MCSFTGKSNQVNEQCYFNLHFHTYRLIVNVWFDLMQGKLTINVADHTFTMAERGEQVAER